MGRQYWQYGCWKRRMLLGNPRSVRLRQLAAPALVLGLGMSAVLLAWSAPFAAMVPAVYLSAVGLAAARTSGAPRGRVALAFVTMHLAWGAGFLVGR